MGSVPTNKRQASKRRCATKSTGSSTWRSIMKRELTALVLAGSLATAAMATPTPAHARWGWGWGLGAFALGAFVGAALARPAYAYYPAYSYGYAYPAYPYGYASQLSHSPMPTSLFVWLWRLLCRLPAYYRPALYGGYRVARRSAIIALAGAERPVVSARKRARPARARNDRAAKPEPMAAMLHGRTSIASAAFSYAKSSNTDYRPWTPGARVSGRRAWRST